MYGSFAWNRYRDDPFSDDTADAACQNEDQNEHLYGKCGHDAGADTSGEIFQTVQHRRTGRAAAGFKWHLRSGTGSTFCHWDSDHQLFCVHGPDICFCTVTYLASTSDRACISCFDDTAEYGTDPGAKRIYETFSKRERACLFSFSRDSENPSFRGTAESFWKMGETIY